MGSAANLASWAKRLQGRRGVRAVVAVGSAMLVCHRLGIPPAAAALGAFNPLLVDNGGPYRTRLTTMATASVGGAVAFVLGALLPHWWFAVIPATLAVTFVLTYARVLSQPVASSSVLILVLYFAGLGGTQHTWSGALTAAELVALGGAWSITLSLVLWPVDAFRPARLAVAECYGAMAEFTESLSTETDPEARMRAAHEWQRRQRTRMEDARAALSATGARAPSRTIRARNLTVLLETSDLLLARTMRLTELAGAGDNQQFRELTRWLAAAERAVAGNLAQKPADDAASFGHGGSHRMQFLPVARLPDGPAQGSRHLQVERQDATLEITVAFDALRAIWTGSDLSQPFAVSPAGAPRKAWDLVFVDSTWLDAVRANWTLKSANLRHALRLAIVGAVDVLVMRLIHVNHGFWLPMTSILLMQPFSAGTNRKSLQRVTGTIAGGIFAALLAATMPSQLALFAAVTLLAGLAVASFSVDYAVYCFFLTPTFVLLSLPYPHDWRYAGIRIATTLAGATIAILAMKLLWPERAEAELSSLLRRGAAAEAAYLRAAVAFWETAPAKRRQADRELLAPARRACGLASNDAEEALDRVLQEPRFRPGSTRREDVLAEHALTFTTYLRRLTQSVTTLAPFGQDTPLNRRRLEALADRLQAVSLARVYAPGPVGAPQNRPVLMDVAEEQMQRLERQTGVLERTAAALPAA